MMLEEERPMEQNKAIAIRLVDVLPVVTEEQLKAFAQIPCLGY